MEREIKIRERYIYILLHLYVFVLMFIFALKISKLAMATQIQRCILTNERAGFLALPSWMVVSPGGLYVRTNGRVLRREI